MEKIKLTADSACDIPDEYLTEYNIDMPCVPIAVDGVEYMERKSFSIRQFYDILENAAEIPTTSRVRIDDYLDCYKRAFDEGYTHIINVTINAGGSGTHTSAQMAKTQFFEQYPEAKDTLSIIVVDSRTYSMAYGLPVVEAAKMARAGKTAAEILDYLQDCFDTQEVYLACYSLEYAKYSGRIGAAAAFVGDVLGLRPIILMANGQTKVVEKVRGDKNLPARLHQIYLQNRADADTQPIIIRGALDEPAETLRGILDSETGRSVPVYYAGASIVINSGPKILAVIFRGKTRKTKL